jgi:hypothetical protein
VTTLHEYGRAPVLGFAFTLPPANVPRPAEIILQTITTLEPFFQRRRGSAREGMTWQQAKKIAEHYCRRDGWPGLNALASIVGCSPFTISKALKHSPTLRVRRDEYNANRGTGGRTVQLSDAVERRVVQTREQAPDEAAELHDDGEDAHAIAWARILAKATKDERAVLNAKTIDQQRELVAMLPGLAE